MTPLLDENNNEQLDIDNNLILDENNNSSVQQEEWTAINQDFQQLLNKDESNEIFDYDNEEPDVIDNKTNLDEIFGGY